jgi:TolA-binding protein
MRLRGSGRFLALAAVGLLAAAALPVGGCRRQGAATSAPAGESAEGSGGQSQAERTRAMEEKAREMEKKAAEIQNMQGTEQEKIDAVNKLEQERQELNKTGGDGAASPNPAPQ